MKVDINNTTQIKINKKKIEELVNFFSHIYKNTKDVSIAFVGDTRMKQLNNQYRKINKTTDVLSFSGDEDFLGEILISLTQIKKQASRFKKSFTNELNFILVHGLLHLIGRDDNTERKRLSMITEGEDLLYKYRNK